MAIFPQNTIFFTPCMYLLYHHMNNAINPNVYSYINKEYCNGMHKIKNNQAIKICYYYSYDYVLQIYLDKKIHKIIDPVKT